MKPRKQVRIVASCLFLALAIAVTFTSRTSSVHADKHTNQIKPSALAQPAAYLSGPSLRAAFTADSMLLNSAVAQRVSAQSSNPILPDVEEFTLTPPNLEQGIDKTTLSVRFSERDAEKLASQIPMTLARQNVVLQRSADDPSVFSARVDFNWTAFLKQQQRRQELARRGKTVPIYKGRDFLRRERVQFVDPADIETALQTHQPIRFTPEMIVGGDLVTVVPDHELMIINQAVVEDLEPGPNGRTYDVCINGANKGNPNGAWTFKTLWSAAINASSTQAAEQALDDLLYNWQNPNLTVNTPVSPRPGIGTLRSPSNPNGTGFLANWPVDMTNMCSELNGQTYCPSLNAPVRLNAIVNRIDLAGQPTQTPAGEFRFVFGFTAGNQPGQTCYSEGPQPSSGPPFNIIFEYHVPTTYMTAAAWATQWDSLPKDNFNYNNCPADGCYIPMLQSNITDMVVKSNSCNGNTCLFHIRTNELLLTGSPAIWELREFGVNYGSGGNANSIFETEVDQTPYGSFNFGGGPCYSGHGTPNGEPDCPMNITDTNFPTLYLNTNQLTIDEYQGVQPLLPLDTNNHPPSPFLGGSSLNAITNGTGGPVSATYWNVCPVHVNQYCTLALQNDNGDSGYQARRYFSLNTCNGCHGDETNTGLFQQVFNRLPEQQSSLSTFLLGCVPTTGSCAFGNAGPANCTVGTMGTQQPDQCNLNTPGQESFLDPDAGETGYNSYGDIARRQMYLQGLLGVPGPLLPFTRPHIGVH